MNSSDFLIGAPKFITIRFNSINKYVWESLYPESVRNAIILKKKTKQERINELKKLKSISDEASIVVFIFLMNKFFVEGANATILAVDTFKELDINSFQIGKNFFCERNDKVVQGMEISKRLIESIKEIKVKKLISESKFVSEILDEYRKLNFYQ